MRFSIHTLGTRGDTQPYLALSRGLRAHGHEVLIVAPAQFAEMAAAEAVAFAPLPAEVLAVLDSPEAKKVIGSAGTGFGAGFKLLKSRDRPAAARCRMESGPRFRTRRHPVSSQGARRSAHRSEARRSTFPRVTAAQ